MQKVNELTKKEKIEVDLEENIQKAMQDKEFVALINKFKITPDVLKRNTSKFENVVWECKNCQKCKGLYACQNSFEGHFMYPKILENRLYFSYIPCKYQKQVENKITNDKKLANITMKDIDTKDKKQLKVIKWMDEFYENFDLAKNNKGLYLHGSFGSGKTFLLTALLNQLALKKNISVSIVYLADMLRDLKEDWEDFAGKMNHYMNVDILLIDDIGAEKVTEWGRDEILGTILQSRMNNEKTTFFTSNLTINELEEHLSLASGNVDKVKSRRIIERIKQLTSDMELVSVNRRN